MSESGKFSDRAAELAEKAAAKAGPLAQQAKIRATELAAQARTQAGPMAAQAKEKAAHSVEPLAQRIDKATGHKYTDRITSVSSKLKGALEKKPGATPPPSTPSAAPPMTPPAATPTEEPPVTPPADPTV